MAYIYYNGEKYFPLMRFFEYDLLNLSTNKSAFFEVDELMALPIACLNNKGYLTKMSCSGHMIGDLCCETADTTDIEAFRADDCLITVQYLNEDDAEYMCWVGESPPGAFIMFKNKVKFSSIPEGWEYNPKYQRLSCDVPCSKNPMTYYKNIATALESLMDWIIQLPPIEC